MAKLYFRYSAMNAGKSLALLQVAHNYLETGDAVRVFTSEVDNRYGVGRVTSRLGPSREAETFDGKFDFLHELEGHLEGIACILIDEAQFLTKTQVMQLHRLAASGKVPVLAYGIRSDSKGEPFEGALTLLTLAEDIEELKTVCKCGKKATMNMRVDGAGEMVLDGEQVVIGGHGQYKSVCAKCFYAKRQQRVQASAPLDQ